MTSGRTGALLLLLASTALLPPSLAAQGWRVEAAAGRAVHDPVSARINSTVASFGVGYEHGPERWLYLSAGTPLDGAGPAWGAGGAGGWLGVERGRWTAGASLGAHLFGYAAADTLDGGGGATVEAIPALTWAHGRVRAELAAGLVASFDRVDGGTRTRGGLDSGARASLSAAPGVVVSADARYLRVEGEGWPYAGGAVEVERGPAAGWAFAGGWLRSTALDPSAAFGVGASYRVDRRTRVEAAVRQEPTDPLYLSVPRRTWSVQASRSIGRPREDGVPFGGGPSLHPVVEGGIATFRFPAAGDEAAPALIGDFTGWRPAEMTRSGGWWTVSVAVQPGVHHYAFRRADGSTFVPTGVPSVDDGFGGRSAVLVAP